MSLLCIHEIPTGYDDNNNNGQQHLGNGYWGKNWCLLIKPDKLGMTSLPGNNTDEANWYRDSTSAIRVRPGFKLTAYEHSDGGGASKEYIGGANGYNEKINNFNDKIDSVK